MMRQKKSQRKVRLSNVIGSYIIQINAGDIDGDASKRKSEVMVMQQSGKLDKSLSGVKEGEDSGGSGSDPFSDGESEKPNKGAIRTIQDYSEYICV